MESFRYKLDKNVMVEKRDELDTKDILGFFILQIQSALFMSSTYDTFFKWTLFWSHSNLKFKR